MNLTEEEKQVILTKAILDYPNGTVFNSTGGNNNITMIDYTKLFWSKDGHTDELRTDNAANKDGRIFTTHNGPRWAEIIKPGIPEVINNYDLY